MLTSLSQFATINMECAVKKFLFFLSLITVVVISYFLMSKTLMRDTKYAVENKMTTNDSISNEDYASVREEMVVTQIEARGVSNPVVLNAMRSVPRHEFVLEQYVDRAYIDQPLPINHGQTISQPYIVALMSELLEIEVGEKVLEIGTGSGYQAAVLVEMGAEVYTVEIIPELAQEARQRFDKLGYTQINSMTADGYFGWLEHAPFNAIIVTAAPDHLPQPLANQLAESGRLIIPIGPVGDFQTLWLFEKTNGELQATNMGGVRFVPLTGDH